MSTTFAAVPGVGETNPCPCELLQLAAGFAAGALIAALLLGQAYATIDRAVGALIARLAGGAA